MHGFKNIGRHPGSVGRKKFFKISPAIPGKPRPYKKYVRGEGNYLFMSNDESIPVARNKKEKLIERFGWLQTNNAFCS